MQRPRTAVLVAVLLLSLASCATRRPAAEFRLQQAGPGLYLAGAGETALIVEMGTHLIVFDPPADEAQPFLEATKKRFPGKPLRYLVFTQRPMDRPELLRAYLDQRTEWIVPRGAGEDLRRALASPRTLIVEIADKYVLADAEREVDLLPANGPPPDRLVGYVRELGGNAGRLLLEHHLP